MLVFADCKKINNKRMSTFFLIQTKLFFNYFCVRRKMSSKRARSTGLQRSRAKRRRKATLLEMLPSEVAKYLDSTTLSSVCRVSASLRKLYLPFRSLLRKRWGKSVSEFCHDTTQVETSASFVFSELNTAELQHFPRLKKLKLFSAVKTMFDVRHLPGNLQVLKLACKSGPNTPLFKSPRSNWPPHLQRIKITTQCTLHTKQHFNVYWPSTLTSLKIQHAGGNALLKSCSLESSQLPATLTLLEFFHTFTYHSSLPNLIDVNVGSLVAKRSFPVCLKKLQVRDLEFAPDAEFRLPPTLDFFSGNPISFAPHGFNECIIQELDCCYNILGYPSFANVQSLFKISAPWLIHWPSATFSSSLKSMHIQNEDLSPDILNQLPVGLTSLRVGLVDSNCVFPNGLTKLVILDFNVSFLPKCFPDTLQELMLIDYNAPFTPECRFPPNLKSLTLVAFNHPIDETIFPSKLERLLLICFNDRLRWKYLPRSLIHLEVSECAKDIVGDQKDIPPLLQSCFRPYVVNKRKLPYYVSEKVFFSHKRECFFRSV